MLLGEGHVSVPRACVQNVFVKRPTHSTVSRVFLFKDAVLNVVLMNSHWPRRQQHRSACVNAARVTRIFSRTHVHLSFLPLKNTRLCFAVLMGREVTKNRHKKVENVALNVTLQQRYLFTERELTGGSRASRCLRSARTTDVRWLHLSPLRMSAHDHGGASTGFAVTHELSWVGEFANMKSVRNQGRPYGSLNTWWGLRVSVRSGKGKSDPRLQESERCLPACGSLAKPPSGTVETFYMLIWVMIWVYTLFSKLIQLHLIFVNTAVKR